jgi:NarL family two-component system response regulator LiaR
MSKIRVLVVDDHPMLREALVTAIEAEADLEVAGEAVNGQQAVEDARTLAPDVIVMDLFLPVKDGVTAIAEIMALNPEARILAITSSTEDERVLAAVQAGAAGYLLKDASRTLFLQGLRAVAAGKTFLPPEVAEKLARGVRQAGGERTEEASPEQLTRREQEILALLGEGLSNRAIADRLSLSESTVRVHVYNILGKLGLEDRGQAIVYALRKSQSK